MSDPGSYFAQGGPWMWVITGLSLTGSFFVFLALILSIFARLKGRMVGFARFLAILTLIGCFIPVCAGFAAGWGLPDEASAAAADFPMWYGLCLSLCCLVPVFAALLVLPRKKRAWEEALDESRG